MIANRSNTLSPSQQHRLASRHATGRAFTMLEVLLTMGIFAVGFVAVAAIFPTAILLQKKTVEDVVAQQVARNAQAVLETRGIKAGTNNTQELWQQLEEAESPTTWDTDQRVRPLPMDMLTLTGPLPLPTPVGTTPNQRWLLPDRSYPSSTNPPVARKIFWVPFVRDPNRVASVTPSEVMVYVFIIQRASDGRYPRPDFAPGNWANFYDGYVDSAPTGPIPDPGDTWTVPGITRQAVSVSTSDLTRFDFGAGNNTWASTSGTAFKVNIGDQILDCFGGIYTVQDVDANGVKVAGIINPNLDTSAFPNEIWYAHPDASGKLRPTKRILTLTEAVK